MTWKPHVVLVHKRQDGDYDLYGGEMLDSRLSYTRTLLPERELDPFLAKRRAEGYVVGDPRPKRNLYTTPIILARSDLPKALIMKCTLALRDVIQNPENLFSGLGG